MTELVCVCVCVSLINKLGHLLHLIFLIFLSFLSLFGSEQTNTYTVVWPSQITMGRHRFLANCIVTWQHWSG